MTMLYSDSVTLAAPKVLSLIFLAHTKSGKGLCEDKKGELQPCTHNYKLTHIESKHFGILNIKEHSIHWLRPN